MIHVTDLEKTLYASGLPEAFTVDGITLKQWMADDVPVGPNQVYTAKKLEHLTTHDFSITYQVECAELVYTLVHAAIVSRRAELMQAAVARCVYLDLLDLLKVPELKRYPHYLTTFAIPQKYTFIDSPNPDVGDKILPGITGKSLSSYSHVRPPAPIGGI